MRKSVSYVGGPRGILLVRKEGSGMRDYVNGWDGSEGLPFLHPLSCDLLL